MEYGKYEYSTIAHFCELLLELLAARFGLVPLRIGFFEPLLKSLGVVLLHGLDESVNVDVEVPAAEVGVRSVAL